MHFQDWRWRTPLDLAAQEGHWNIINDVIFKQDGQGQVTLHRAAEQGRLEVVDAILRRCDSIDRADAAAMQDNIVFC